MPMAFLHVSPPPHIRIAQQGWLSPPQVRQVEEPPPPPLHTSVLPAQVSPPPPPDAPPAPLAG